jgi:glycosyltransferase involved in cell wall biosynthesis
MKKKYLYVVPRKKFFSEGYRGRVMHSLGVAEGLALNGNSVDIIGGDGLIDFKGDLPDDVSLIELKETKKSFFGFLAWNFKVFKKVIEVSRLNNYEVLIVRYAISSYFLLLFMSVFSNIKKKVIEVNTFAYHHFFQNSTMSNKIIIFFEVYLVNFYDILYVVSDRMAKDRRNKNVKGIIISIPNGATSKQIDFSQVENKHNKVRLLYLGSLMGYWDYEPIIEAVRDSQDLYEFHFYGDGPSRKLLENKMKGLSHVKFHGRFKRTELGSLINPKADILFLPPQTIAVMKKTGGLSTKAFDYLAMKMPIIVPIDGELNNIFKHKKNAMLYRRDNWEEINTAVREILADKHLREEISQNAYSEFLEKYSWKSRMIILIDKVELETRVQSLRYD